MSISEILALATVAIGLAGLVGFYLLCLIAPGPATGLLMWFFSIRGRLRYDWRAEAWKPNDR